MPQGTVSWFDTTKGFGFVAPDDGGPDVFVHASQVGDGQLDQGQRVEFEVRQGDRGPQAEHVVALADDRPAPPEAERRQGAVAWFDADKGFGFVTPDDGTADVFVHVPSLPFDGPLEEGERVEFEVRQGDRGPQAHRVKLLDVVPEDRPMEGPLVHGTVLMQGTVSWFSEDKGFGFVVPDDLFVHGSAVAGGVLAEGQRVVFEVVQGERGLQAEQVQPVGGAPRRTPDPVRAPAAAPPGAGRTAGTVAWFTTDKGFGFITPDDGSGDVFVHFSALPDDGGPRSLAEGDRVEFEVRVGERGRTAAQVSRTG